MHRVDHDPQTGAPDSVEIYQPPEILQIQRFGVEILHKTAPDTLSKRGGFELPLPLGIGDVTFEFGYDLRRSAAPVVRLELITVPLRWIVTRGNDYPIARFPGYQVEPNGGRGRRSISEEYAETVSCKHLSDRCRETLGCEPRVVANCDRSDVAIRCQHVRRSLGAEANVVEGEVGGDDPTPAVGPELYWHGACLRCL